MSRATEGSPPRRFLITWRDGGRPAGIHPVGRLVFDGRYHFSYLPDAVTVRTFRTFPSFPELDGSYTSATLFPFFSSRVMDRRRPERPAFLRALDLPEDAADLDVLARNEGARKGDGVAVVEEPAVQPSGWTSHVFVVRGLRFQLSDLEVREAVLQQLCAETVLSARLDETNQVNQEALALLTPDGHAVGWVPDALVPYVDVVLAAQDGCVRVQRCNGPDQPAHLRLLARVSGTVAPDAVTLPQLARLAAAPAVAVP